MVTKKEALSFISKGRTKKCINLLLEFSSEQNLGDFYSNIIQVSSRFNKIEEMFRKNIISSELYNIELNKINVAIIEYIQKNFTIK